ncbi:Mur ligase family protein, partial [Francisella tularensis subsp. holarctica]|uniref:Mur ligase family protein n=1 Tax=Francisella tularensis TaxID=263 RepID=UPI002381975E
KYNQSDKNVKSYGFSINADVQIYYYHIIDEITHFKIRYKGDDLIFKLQLPGRYNVQNAPACIITCLDLGFKYEDIRNA